MIYPHHFEEKIGFTEVRSLLDARCLSSLGRDEVQKMSFSADSALLNRRMQEISELRRIRQEEDSFPLDHCFDMRESLCRIRHEGTYLEEEELFDLKRSLETIDALVVFLRRGETDGQGIFRYDYPTLFQLAENVVTFPTVVQRIAQVIDRMGKIRDTASPELLRLRRELARMEGSIARTLYNILRSAQQEGVVERDVTPTLRDGRLVIPVVPALKRRISGIVHDESATGRTVFIEPTEVVEANNKVRELENEERREIIRILTELAGKLRPHIGELLDAYRFLGKVDFVHAKAVLADEFHAFEPEISPTPQLDWLRAVHPLLQRSLERKASLPQPDSADSEDDAADRQARLQQPTSVVPLDIQLAADRRILIISGPNAGGKSVCLKTVGLLQYMLQCGVSIPVGERSSVGVFENLMIDIGDEQSIENDLSTYSSHLRNMKLMMRHADGQTLLLIDEFGTGTEPQIGGAIAESVLRQFWQRHAWAVITTHYRNLKHFADNHEGVVNGAMLYDRHEMRPLFQLAIGRPGSSFAIEIARKTGLSEVVIRDAAAIVGSDYIQSDKYLQDIVRDKRYWEAKRQTVHSREKELEKLLAQCEQEIAALQQSRREIISKAKREAEEIIKESNRRIENTIREIREAQAEREETKRIRHELAAYEDSLANPSDSADSRKQPDRRSMEASGLMNEADFQKQIEKIRNRKQRHEERQHSKAEPSTPIAPQPTPIAELQVGDKVHMKGQTSVGRIESIDGKQATVVFGGMRARMAVSRLEPVDTASLQAQQKPFQAYNYSRDTRETIDRHRNNFRYELDVRGTHADDALAQVERYIDDAILVGATQVRILHGKGNGTLRQLIRQYLATVPGVSEYHDEHVQFGGTGITVVRL